MNNLAKRALSIVCVILTVTLSGCADMPRTDSFVAPSPYSKAVQSSTYYEAVHQYSALYAQDKNNLPALLGLARNLRYSGQPEHAIEQLRAAEDRFGAHYAFLTELGKAHLAAGEIGPAKDVLKEATKVNPDNGDAWSALGIVYDFQRDFRRSATSYSRAVELCPDSASILNNMAISLAQSGDLKNGQALLKRAASLRPYSEQIAGNLKLFRQIGITCPYCDKGEIARQVGATVTPQDWGTGDLACSVGPGEIIETLSHADFIDLKVEFAFDKASLTPDARTMLDGLGYALSSKELSTLRFLIEGHTDAAGSESYNKDLSERRGAAVKEYLVKMLGISSDRLETVGYGETRLLDTENPKSGKNRRVRILRID